jgi:hypothetical protein
MCAVAYAPSAFRDYDQRCCDAGCTDTSYDHDNCGSCGIVCPTNTACLLGNCFPAFDCSQPSTDSQPCALDGAYYTGTCCSGSCMDLSNGAPNCASCLQTCPAGSNCFYGTCFTDGGTATICDAGGCPSGTFCNNGFCFAETSCSLLPAKSTCVLDAGTSLSLGNCCADACVDLQSDSSNCGICFSQCPTGVACSSYVCASGCNTSNACPAGTTCVYADGQSSGSCQAVSCTGEADGVECVFGPGVFPYNSSSGTCCGGRCVGINDPQNCSGCGQVCDSGICNDGVCLDPDPPAGCLQSCAPFTRCVNGTCIDGLCNGVNTEYVGYVALCLASDGTVGNCCLGGGCGHLLDDPQNCGVCYVACPSGQTCANGTCSGSPTCGPGHMGEFCNLDAGQNYLCCPGYGCIDVAGDDSKNCGGCGLYCLAGTSCVKGSCI